MSTAPALGGSGPAETAPPTGIRVFFAVWPDPTVAATLVSLAGALSLQAPAHLQPADQLHMTVAFVGEIGADRLEELLEVGRRQRACAMQLQVDAYEYWPKPEVVVAAARAVPAALVEFWEQLHRDLATRQLGLTPKRLRPHVTLARKVTQAPVLPPLSAVTLTVRNFSLASSARLAGRSVYTVLESWPLLDG